MPVPAETPIPIGLPHRTLRALELLVYEYDELGVSMRVLPAGRAFQPWEPLPHWRGRRVPITLGEGAAGFDWGVTSSEGLFLNWDDFFGACGTAERAPFPAPVNERTIDPFAGLPEIVERLRARAAGRPEVTRALAERLDRLEALRRAHAEAAAMELGAAGYDTSVTMRFYSEEQERLMAEAREVLAACRGLVL